MNDLVQYLLAGLIVAAAVFAVGRALWRAAHDRETVLTACASCKLQDVCRKPNFAPLNAKGRLDEWFSHRSAKPGTAVRVR